MKKLLLVIFICATIATLQAQNTNQVVNAGGEHFSNGNISLSYSIGEAVITTHATEENILTQGFLQPETDRDNGEQILIDFYPNPVTDDLYLTNAREVSYYLIYNTEGKFIKKALFQPNLPIPMKTLAGGMYFIELYDREDSMLTSLKIIKI